MSIQPIPWYRAWIGILRYPSVYNFEVLLLNPNARRTTAYRWLATVGILTNLPGIVSLVISVPRLTGDPPPFALPNLWIGVLALLFLSALVGMMGLILTVAIQNIMAKLLGGKGTYSQLIYAEATFYAPLLLISSILNLIPYVWVLTYAVDLYGFILSIRAIKAIHQIGWGKAIVSSLALVFLFVLGGALGAGIFSLSQHR